MIHLRQFVPILVGLASIATSIATAQPLLKGTAIPLDKVPVETFVPANKDSLVFLAAAEPVGGAYQFAEPIDALVTPWTHGVWETLEDGRRLWRLRVDSPGALSLNFGFLDFELPDGATLTFHSMDGSLVSGPFDARQNKAHRQFWTPVVEAPEVVIEVVVPGEAEGELSFLLASVNYGFRPFYSSPEKSGSCNVDVACDVAEPWRDHVNSVARYSRLGTIACTGALINTTANDGRQLFLTANHCNVTPTSAPTMVFYWNYENSTCRLAGSAASGQRGDGPTDRTSHGATFLASSSISDFALVEIDDPIPAEYEPWFAGWRRTPDVPESVVCIHHPSGDEKRISFASQVTTTTYLSEVVNTQGTHWRVVRWDLGTTEGGSSGSPLFDENGLIIGQLHGGWAACGNNRDDWYGRFSRSWNGGGTPSSRLSDWLDPLGTGADIVNGRGLDPLSKVPGSQRVLDPLPTGDGDGRAEPGEEILVYFSLVNVSQDPVAGISATATSRQGAIEVLQGFTAFPDLLPNQSAESEVPLRLFITGDHPCGEPIILDITVLAGEREISIPTAVPTGPICDVLPRLVLATSPILEDFEGNGNGNGRLDPGESSVEVTVQLRNIGSILPAMDYTLTAVTETAYVHASANTRSFPAMQNGQEFNNIIPFLVGLYPHHPCGDPVELMLQAADPSVPPIPVRFDLTQIQLHTESVFVNIPVGPDPGIAGVDIYTTATGIVRRVTPRMRILHTFTGDMSIRLLSPSGSDVLLFNRHGGAGDHLLNTTFSDDAATPISSGSAPFAGSYRPVALLSTLIGEEVATTWTLRVEDHQTLDGGAIEWFQLEFLLEVPECAPVRNVEMEISSDQGTNLFPGGGVLDFGTTLKGQGNVVRTVTIRNPGEVPLFLFRVGIPPGYRLNAPAPSFVAVGGETSIIIILDDDTGGSFSGDVVIESSFPTHPSLAIPINGWILGPVETDAFVVY